MADNNKVHAEWIDIPDGSSGTQRIWYKDAEARAGIAQVASAIGMEPIYVDLGLPSGTLWAKCNLGATEETGYGGFWQYGKGARDFFETAGEDMYTGKEDPLSLQNDAVAQIMGSPWHLPTKAQLEEMVENTAYQWMTDFNGSGVTGVKFTAANGNYIFLPASGMPYADGDIDDRNDIGTYLTSTPADGTTANPYLWWILDIMKNRYVRLSESSGEYEGCSVRGVMDSNPYDITKKADKSELPTYATVATCESIIDELT